MNQLTHFNINLLKNIIQRNLLKIVNIMAKWVMVRRSQWNHINLKKLER